jgi:hypothetical protein
MAIVTETRSVTGFDEVILRGYGEVVIEQNDGQTGPESVTIEADQSIMDRLGAEVRGGRLVLGFSMPWYEWLGWGVAWLFLPHKGIRYTVRANQVRGVTLTGSGSLRSQRLVTDRCGLRITGSGRIAVDSLKAGALQAAISGSGSISCAGEAEDARVDITGSGSVEGDRMAARSARISISGSGGVSISASGTLDARITGSGSVRYHGSPRVSSSVTGSGRVVASPG